MARFVNVAVAVSFVAVVLMQCVAAQTVHVVGDSMGWTIPQSGGAGAYDTWAASNTFRVGDILTFNFGTGDHDVLQVPKASYDGCTAANPIGNTITTAPANITITSAGDHYYICTFSQHCQFGQKLQITAVSSSPTPGGAPSPDTTMGPTANGPSPITLSPPTSSSSPTPGGGAPSPADCPPDSIMGPTAHGPSPITPPDSSSSTDLAGIVVSILSIIIGFEFIF